MKPEAVRIDGVIWQVAGLNVYPLCPKHYLRLRPNLNDYRSQQLICADCVDRYNIPRVFFQEAQYVRDRLDSKELRNLKVMNLDDEAVPIAEDEVSSKDERYFVIARLVESKVGLRLVIYAGEKGNPKKTQIFVEPDIKRIAFDQKDLHPTDVFVEIYATFADGTRASFKKGK